MSKPSNQNDPAGDHPEKFNELELQQPVLDALNQMGYEKMTPVQALSIPHILSGMDFLGQAPTGTGKTAAFGIPLVNMIEPGQANVQALIIGPTRELVQQIAEELSEIGKVKGVKTLAVYGGESMYMQKKALREENIDIVVGTPGRILDHLRNFSLNLNETRLVVLDEADIMLDMGFLPDIEDIFAKVPQGRQTLLFSATMSKEIRRIADKYMMYPEEIRIQPQVTSAERIKQYYYIGDDEAKANFIRNLLDENPDLYGLVFCTTKKGVVELTRKFRDRYPVECIHGAMPQDARNSMMERFRNKEYQMLIATDVLARGIDVDNLTHIVNYEPPNDSDSYIHRIGRTARAGTEGVAITMFTPYQERDLKLLEKQVSMDLSRHPECEEEFKEGRPPRGGRGGGGRGRGGGGRGRGRGGGGPRGRSGGSGRGRSGGGGGRRRGRGGGQKSGGGN